MQYYEYKCTHCLSTNVFAAINDGGSVQTCKDCGQTYKAKKIEAPAPIDMGFPSAANRLRYCFIKNQNNG